MVVELQNYDISDLKKEMVTLKPRSNSDFQQKKMEQSDSTAILTFKRIDHISIYNSRTYNVDHCIEKLKIISS